MTINFYLAYPKAEMSAIICKISDGHKRKRVGTGIRVRTTNWSAREQKLRKNCADVHFNHKLAFIRANVSELFLVAEKTRVSDKLAYVHETLLRNGVLHNREMVEAVADGTERDVLAECQTYLQRCEDRVKPGTMKMLQVVFGHFQRFLGLSRSLYLDSTLSNTPEVFPFSCITENFYDQYVKYLFEDVGLTSSTVSTNLKKVKQYLDYCSEKGYLPSSQYKSYFKWSRFNKEATLIALTENELESIENLDLSDSPRLSRVRDLFLIQCFTGLRYSDILRLSASRFQGNRIVMHTQKDGKRVYLPIHPRLQRVLQRYPEYSFPTISLTKVNNYIKEIGERAGLLGNHVVTRYNAKGEMIETVVQRKDALSTHVGRRTFITLSLKLGVPRDIVKEASGHRTNAAFEKYVKFSSIDVENMISSAWSKR